QAAPAQAVRPQAASTRPNVRPLRGGNRSGAGTSPTVGTDRPSRAPGQVRRGERAGTRAPQNHPAQGRQPRQQRERERERRDR
ncbi:MAG TPA: hypothetical protein VF889_04370, partial [Bacteroidota bacterium]